MADAYPLQWAVGRPRWKGSRQPSQFKMTPSAMTAHLFDELYRLGASDIVVSSNKKPYSRSEAEYLDDPGVAVYFKRKGSEIAICCDKYAKISDNLHAIGLAVQAFRSLERHGTGEMVDAAFTGFKALPEAIITPPPNREPRQWYEVLGVKPDASPQEVKQAYRDHRYLAHPDNGGKPGEFEEIQQAYDYWRKI